MSPSRPSRCGITFDSPRRCPSLRWPWAVASASPPRGCWAVAAATSHSPLDWATFLLCHRKNTWYLCPPWVTRPGFFERARSTFMTRTDDGKLQPHEAPGAFDLTESPVDQERLVGMEFIRATEAGALAAYRWMGKGDKESADFAASDSIR